MGCKNVDISSTSCLVIFSKLLILAPPEGLYLTKQTNSATCPPLNERTADLIL